MLAEDVYHHLMVDLESPGGGWLQEDLAPCRASECSNEATAALGLKVLVWVGQSPDLDPAENAWKELDRLVARSVDRSLEQRRPLCGTLCEE